jgi:hypothetical protein
MKCGKNIVVACLANDELGVETVEISPRSLKPTPGRHELPVLRPT